MSEQSAVALRPFRPSDVLIVRQWRNDPDVARYMFTDHHIGEAEHARWFARALEAPDRRDWVIEVDGRPVGAAHLRDVDRRHGRASCGFYLADPALRGRRVGSSVEELVLRHAFLELGLRRVWCEVLATNRPGIRVHERAGFATEGVLRRHVVKQGEPVDVVVLGLLAEEWRERHGDGAPG